MSWQRTRDVPHGDRPNLCALALIERAAPDGRNDVKKGISWALRSIGHRNALLHDAALRLARRLPGASDPASRWIGRDALRDLERPVVKKKIARRGAR